VINFTPRPLYSGVLVRYRAGLEVMEKRKNLLSLLRFEPPDRPSRGLPGCSLLSY